MFLLHRQQLCQFLLCLTALFPLHVVASNDSHLEVLRISIVNARPWGWQENGENKGLLVQLANDLSRELNVPVEFHTGSVSRVIRQVSLGQTDFIYFMENQRLETSARRLNPLGHFDLQLWQLRQQDNHSSHAENSSPNNRHLASSIQGLKQLPALKQANIKLVHSADLLIPMLVSGRTSGIIELAPVLQFSQQRMGYSQVAIDTQTLLTVPTYLWVSNHTRLSPDAIEKVRLAAAKVNPPGAVQHYLKQLLQLPSAHH